MKLVNPVGRAVDDVTNQANYGCSCSVTPGVYSSSSNSGGSGFCKCSCSYGSENQSANYSLGRAR